MPKTDWAKKVEEALPCACWDACSISGGHHPECFAVRRKRVSLLLRSFAEEAAGIADNHRDDGSKPWIGEQIGTKILSMLSKEEKP